MWTYDHSFLADIILSKKHYIMSGEQDNSYNKFPSREQIKTDVTNLEQLIVLSTEFHTCLIKLSSRTKVHNENIIQGVAVSTQFCANSI